MDDEQIIRDLGGPTEVARLLGWDPKGGAQRVQNWITRGIPAEQKLAHPDLFFPELTKAAPNGDSDRRRSSNRRTSTT